MTNPNMYKATMYNVQSTKYVRVQNAIPVGAIANFVF